MWRKLLHRPQNAENSVREQKPFPAMPMGATVPSAEDARTEQRASTRRFVDAAHQGPEIRQVSSEMRDLRIRNGFEQQILDAFLAKRGSTRP